MRLPILCLRPGACALFLLVPVFLVSPALTQEPTPAVSGIDGLEVLTRGPIHEAYAEPVAFDPAPGPVITLKPPQSIRELPPEVKPAGDVIWIEGYWLFEVERNDFVWVSGVWRVPPRGRRWVPGYWADVEGGHQWTSGFWIGDDADELGYLTPPPQSLENGPTSPSPSDVYFWVPGCWLNQGGEYSWRPGFWTPHHSSWVWIPDRYVWTPRGCIFVPGYWDHGLADRGTLFAPVHLSSESRHANYLYTPDCVIGGSSVYLHLWVRPSDRHYCFGDYYGHDHSGHGIHRWYDYHRNRHGYCPLYVNYMHRYRHHAGEHLHRMTAWHQYFTKHHDRRPRHTLSGQRDFERRHRGEDHARHSLMGRTLKFGELHARSGSVNRQPSHRSANNLGGRPDFPRNEFGSQLLRGQGRNESRPRSARNGDRTFTDRSLGRLGTDAGAGTSRGGSDGVRSRAARGSDNEVGGRSNNRGDNRSRGRASNHAGGGSHSGTFRRNDSGSSGRSSHRGSGSSGVRSSNRGGSGSGGRSLNRGGGSGSGGRSFSRGGGGTSGRSSGGRSSGGSRSGGGRGG
jgi:hypothetical protein